MDAQSVMLVKILTDVAMTAMQTIAKVDKMTEEEIRLATMKAEATSKTLLGKVRTH